MQKIREKVFFLITHFFSYKICNTLCKKKYQLTAFLALLQVEQQTEKWEKTYFHFKLQMISVFVN